MLNKGTAISFINALLEVAKDKGLFDQVENDLELICEVISRYDAFLKIIFNPSITRKDKKKLLKKIFGKSVSQLTMNFLNLIVDRRKEKMLQFFPMVSKDVICAKKGVVTAEVQTVIPLKDDRLEKLKKTLESITGKVVEIKVVENPSIIGGLVIRIGNKLIDGSIANRLKELKTRLLTVQTA